MKLLAGLSLGLCLSLAHPAFSQADASADDYIWNLAGPCRAAETVEAKTKCYFSLVDRAERERDFAGGANSVIRLGGLCRRIGLSCIENRFAAVKGRLVSPTSWWLVHQVGGQKPSSEAMLLAIEAAPFYQSIVAIMPTLDVICEEGALRIEVWRPVSGFEERGTEMRFEFDGTAPFDVRGIPHRLGYHAHTFIRVSEPSSVAEIVRRLKAHRTLRVVEDMSAFADFVMNFNLNNAKRALTAPLSDCATR